MSVKILSIESGADVCSVVLSEDDQIVAIKEIEGSKSHAAHLPANIDVLLKENNLRVADLDAIAISEGPGSYTGLRIGVSTAKGLCYASQRPMIAVNSLKSMAVNAIEKWNNPTTMIDRKSDSAPLYICPMLDARRMEVYTAMYRWDLTEVSKVRALVVEPGAFDEILEQGKILFCGNGALKTEPLLQHTNAIFMAGCISAKGMVPLALAAFHQGKFADIAYFEPFYLKEFIALPSKKMF